MAASFTEDVVAQLVKLGFSNITAETTLLGRVKIVASRSDGLREIVINPRTGEILRDVWMPSANNSAAPRTVLNDYDDDEDDDNSGSGSDDDNSGSGSSGDDRDDDNSGSGSGGDDRDDVRDDREDDRDDRADDRDDDRDDKKDN